jgi:hypothetical protein
MHIHVVKAEHEAKFWLEPEIEMAENHGFKNNELKQIIQIIEEYGNQFRQQFKEHIVKLADD